MTTLFQILYYTKIVAYMTYGPLNYENYVSNAQ